jgi:hypothetical protein
MRGKKMAGTHFPIFPKADSVKIEPTAGSVSVWWAVQGIVQPSGSQPLLLHKPPLLAGDAIRKKKGFGRRGGKVSTKQRKS